MSIYYSHTDITGRLGKDVETKTGTAGKKYTFFSVATQRFVPKDKEPETVWHNVVAFEQNADFLGRYAKKGMWVRVIGEYVNDRFNDKDGNSRESMKLLASKVQLIGRTDYGDGNAPAASDTKSKPVPAGISDEDIPF